MKKYTAYTRFFGVFFAFVACCFAATVDAQIAGGKDAPASASPVEPAEPAVPPSYRLIGTVGGNAFAGAVFDDPTGAQSFSRLYDKLPDGSQIVNIYDDRIALKRPDGTVFEMFTIHDTPKVSASGKPPANPRAWTPPAAAVNRPPVERSANVARPSRMDPGAIAQRAGRNADVEEKRAGRSRRNRDSGMNAGSTLGADPRGLRKRSRDR